ncbi:MAG TPA: polysaccharide deacetylase family protein [Chloroflexota bacterium]
MKARFLAALLTLALALAACGGAATPPTAVESEAASPLAPSEALVPVSDAVTPEPSSAPPLPASLPSVSAAPSVTPKPGTVTTVPILMYHYIRELPPNTPDQLGYGLSIAPHLFEAQLAYLAGAGYESVSMDDLTSHISKGTPLPAKPIVLSFDDGYADFYSAAWPLLKKYRLTATAYLVVDFLGKPGYMSWQQSQELRDAGIEIGAHTMDHVDLAIQPLAQARHQIGDSRSILQQRLNVPVDSFAYPSGRYNATAVKLVADAGFSSAVTTNFGSRHTAANLLTLARVRVPGGISMANFAKNLS